MASSFGEVSWRGKTVPLRNEKARVFILRVQDKNSEIERQESFEKKMEVFDNLLMESKDALQEVKEEISSEMVCCFYFHVALVLYRRIFTEFD